MCPFVPWPEEQTVAQLECMFTPGGARIVPCVKPPAKVRALILLRVLGEDVGVNCRVAVPSVFTLLASCMPS